MPGKRLLRCLLNGGNERGQILVLFAAGLVGFCGLVALSIDVGQLVHMRTDLQKVADASALAGSQDLPATKAAELAAAQYVALNASGVTAEVGFTGNDTIHVTASKSVSFTFLRVLGINSATPSAKATAKGNQEIVTGYVLSATAPFVIWGGDRQNEVNPGDKNCPLWTCVGKSYTFLSEQWMENSGWPIAPDWSADSNNFKGAINHGDGDQIVHVGEDMSVSSPGGLGSVVTPKVGSTIVLPVVSKATGNSDMRTFTIAAWVVVKVDAGCTKQKCNGTVQGPSAAPPGAVVGGTVIAPGELYQTLTVPQLVE